ncbi:MAG: hypothetical protein MHM6MM_007232 [Cercozoa sp. M6MM]
MTQLNVAEQQRLDASASVSAPSKTLWPTLMSSVGKVLKALQGSLLPETAVPELGLNQTLPEMLTSSLYWSMYFQAAMVEETFENLLGETQGHMRSGIDGAISVNRTNIVLACCTVCLWVLFVVAAYLRRSQTQEIRQQLNKALRTSRQRFEILLRQGEVDFVDKEGKFVDVSADLDERSHSSSDKSSSDMSDTVSSSKFLGGSSSTLARRLQVARQLVNVSVVFLLTILLGAAIFMVSTSFIVQSRLHDVRDTWAAVAVGSSRLWYLWGKFAEGAIALAQPIPVYDIDEAFKMLDIHVDWSSLQIDPVETNATHWKQFMQTGVYLESLKGVEIFANFERDLRDVTQAVIDADGFNGEIDIDLMWRNIERANTTHFRVLTYAGLDFDNRQNFLQANVSDPEYLQANHDARTAILGMSELAALSSAKAREDIRSYTEAVTAVALTMGVLSFLLTLVWLFAHTHQRSVSSVAMTMRTWTTERLLTVADARDQFMKFAESRLSAENLHFCLSFDPLYVSVLGMKWKDVVRLHALYVNEDGEYALNISGQLRSQLRMVFENEEMKNHDGDSDVSEEYVALMLNARETAGSLIESNLRCEFVQTPEFLEWQRQRELEIGAVGDILDKYRGVDREAEMTLSVLL